MVLSIRVNGKKINSMAEVLRHGLMVLVMKVTMLKARNMVMASLLGQMAQLMKVSL
jgi:hypothetical protein